MPDPMLAPPRRSIKEPIPAIFEAWECLSRAANAHGDGDSASAEALFREANRSEVWHWTNPAWGPSPEAIRLNVRVWRPAGDTRTVPVAERDTRRHPTQAVKAAVLARDGYRCRYCGIPVVGADIRKIAHALYPEAVPWNGSDVRGQHAAFQCLWLQYDHVVPHSHGGSSSEDNVVVTCGLCNYGKDMYTLKQLGVSDPRLRPPEPTAWDGLERLRASLSTLPTPARMPRPQAKAKEKDNENEAEKPALVPVAAPNGARSAAFFLPGAWIGGGYLYTPPVAGKERWFKLGPDVVAVPATRHGVDGCRLLCEPAQFVRRGLSPDAFLDPIGAGDTETHVRDVAATADIDAASAVLDRQAAKDAR